MLEAMLLDLPLAVLDYHNCPHYVTSGWDICSADHIGPTLEQIASRPERRMMFQRLQLEDSLNLHGDATERLVELIQKMLKLAAEQIPANRPLLNFRLTFSRRSCQQKLSFVIKNYLPMSGSFQNTIRPCSRWNCHTRDEKSNIFIESWINSTVELDQAHQIFEQIDKHPIAGPIVRIRQKMLDLMAAIGKRKNKLDPAYPAPPTDPPKPLAESSSK